jgi:hypothetical protein
MDEGRTGERATGTPNEIYDLSSVLFHALEGGASYDQYIRDAEEAGDQQLVEFFRRVRDEDSMRADEAQRLLAERSPTTAARTEDTAVSAEGVAAGAPPRTEPAGVAPGTGEVSPTGPGERPLGTEGTMPPRTEEAPPRTEATPPPRTEEVSPRAEEGSTTTGGARESQAGGEGAGPAEGEGQGPAGRRHGRHGLVVRAS